MASGFILEILSFESFSQETVLVQGHPSIWNFLDVDLHSLTESHVHPGGAREKPRTFSSAWRAQDQASAGTAQTGWHSCVVSKDLPENEFWMEIFVIVIYQMIFSYCSEIRERPI